MNKTTEKQFYCRKCKSNEWCRTIDMGNRFIVTSLVCGQTVTIQKEAIHE